MSNAQPWPPVETERAVRHPDAPEPGTELPEHYAYCFGCGDQVEHGLHLRATAGGLTVQSRFTVTDQHQGAPGLAHGGLLACAFDEALGTAVGQLRRQPAVTAKLETEFLRPVPVGTTLFIDARVDGVAGRKVYVSADGRADGPVGPVSVRAKALFVQVDLAHFVKNGRPEDIARIAANPALLNRSVDLNP